MNTLKNGGGYNGSPVIQPKVSEFEATVGSYKDKVKKEYPRIVLQNLFVHSIKKIEKTETTGYSASEYNKRQPLYQISVTPFKKLEDGKIVYIGPEDILAPLNLQDKDLKLEAFYINVYDESLVNKFKINGVIYFQKATTILDDSIYEKNFNDYYTTNITAKVQLNDLTMNLAGELTITFDLLDVIEASDVPSIARTKAEEYFKIDYGCLTREGNCIIPLFSFETAKCITQIKPIQGTLKYYYNGQSTFTGAIMYGKAFTGVLHGYCKDPELEKYYGNIHSMTLPFLSKVYHVNIGDPSGDYMLDIVWLNGNFIITEGKMQQFANADHNVVIGFDTLGKINYIDVTTSDSSTLKMNKNESTALLNRRDGKIIKYNLVDNNLVLDSMAEGASDVKTLPEVKTQTTTSNITTQIQQKYYNGCGYSYESKEDCMKQCGSFNGGTCQEGSATGKIVKSSKSN